MKINTVPGNKSVAGNKKVTGKDKTENSEPEDLYIPTKTEDKKEHTHHIANVGFATSTMVSIGRNLKTLVKVASKTKVTRFVPGVNLGVAGLETYHAVKFLKKGQQAPAANSAGNAVGCMGAFLEEGSVVSLLASNARNSIALRVGASACGIIGGCLGLAAGCKEIKEGLEIKENKGSSKTLTLGVLDIASGVTSIAGGVLCATGAGAVFGLPFLIAASVFDMASLVVEYFGEKIEKKLNEKNTDGKKKDSPSETKV